MLQIPLSQFTSRSVSVSLMR